MTLMVSDACVKCKRCEKVCPMQLKPYTAKGKAEGFDHSDCLKCGRCVANCPKNARKTEKFRQPELFCLSRNN